MKYLLILLPILGLAVADFSVFKVVRFPNGACEGSNNKNGTCFTKQECEDRDGKESGTCADGYGVCCTFTIDECDKTSRQNNTYITNPSTVESGICTTTICPSGDDICRLRIDFMTFVIAQPSTETLSGFTNAGGLTPYTTSTQCLNDDFRISCPGGPVPSVLCGTNTGSHMYVDASESCNDLSFNIGTASSTRMWSLKVSQIACDDAENLPPAGCNQWFTEDTGTIQSFNFGTGQKHLASQHQKICFRKNKGMCGVCLAHAGTDFQLNGMAAGGKVGTAQMCCKGAPMSGFDCLQIPGAAKKAAFAGIGTDYFCGSEALLDVAAGAAAATVCTSKLPLAVTFVSDDGEGVEEAARPQAGFKLQYALQSTCA